MTPDRALRRLAGRPVVTVMGVTALLAGAVAAAAVLLPAPGRLMFGAAVMLAVDLAGVWIAAGTARRCTGTERVAFALIATIFALWAATRIIWLGGLVIAGEMPSDLVALEAIWALVGLLTVAMVLLIYMHHREGSSWAGPLDAAVVALALAIVLWNLVFAADHVQRLDAVTATAYFALVGGAATLFAAMAVWRRAAVHRWLRWAILALAPLTGDMALSIAATRTDDTMLRTLAMAVGIVAVGCLITMALVRREGRVSSGPTGASAASASARLRRSRVTRALPAAALIGAVATVTWDRGVPGLLALAAVVLLIARVASSQRAVEQLLDLRSRWALTDHLTGVHNRRLLEHELSVLDADVNHHAVPVSIIALDLDRFKDVNDARGHGVGDVLLREVATALGGTLRDGDQLFRLGGDEFIALLPAATGADAERIGDRLRLAVADTAARVLPDGPVVTISVGIAEVPPGEDGVERARETADRALYAAKASGRNRVVTMAPPASEVAANDEAWPVSEEARLT